MPENETYRITEGLCPCGPGQSMTPATHIEFFLPDGVIMSTLIRTGVISCSNCEGLVARLLSLGSENSICDVYYEGVNYQLQAVATVPLGVPIPATLTPVQVRFIPLSESSDLTPLQVVADCLERIVFELPKEPCDYCPLLGEVFDFFIKFVDSRSRFTDGNGDDNIDCFPTKGGCSTNSVHVQWVPDTRCDGLCYDVCPIDFS
jgi:hypothetical protein